MNWAELRKGIDKMSAEEQLQEVRFMESYDRENAGYVVSLIRAKEDLTIAADDGAGTQYEVVFVQKGQLCLV